MLKPGNPGPLGAHITPEGINFALFSSHATRVELCIFDKSGHQESYELPARSGDVWHGLLPGAKAGLEYGYRVHGAWRPEKGQRFNPAKLLIDPYARVLTGTLPLDERLSGGLNEPDWRDNRDVVPHCIVSEEAYDWGNDRPPNVLWGDTIIYEAHVRGLTQQHPDIPEELRGSYAALSHPVMIEYFKRLGITALELLPVQLHADEPRLQKIGLTNYWGYNVLAPFAIEPSFHSGSAKTTPLSEFRDAVKALHAAGIEVILDIVFNHTAELDETGPMVSLRGIDNRSYYWRNSHGDLENWTGCGNALRLTQPHSVQWVMDCLRYWVEECHVDGFRFDLGTVLGRNADFHRHAPLFITIAQDPVLARVKFIAEPWDIGPNGYQLGHFPLTFSEWNDRYRDEIRQFWLWGNISAGVFAERFAASSQLFRHHGRAPSSSINQITAHDGFTLHDLVSFNDKHNLANGEENRDGSNSNYSNNHGVEGLDANEDIQRHRNRSQRALLATLLLSQGAPMLLAGDEMGHSQQGNNNAYCQDNEIAWLDWSCADVTLTEYTASLIQLRKRIPALCANRWWDENDGNVRWLNANAKPLTTEEWQSCSPTLLQIQLSGDWLVIVNPAQHDEEIRLPAGHWQVSAPFKMLTAGSSSEQAIMPAHSVCVLTRS